MKTMPWSPVRHIVCLLFALCVICGIVPESKAQETSPTADTGKDSAIVDSGTRTHRTIYFARNSSVRNLVYLLEKHFDGESGVKFVAEPSGNLLSIRANSAAAMDDVLRILVKIDRPLRQVAIQVLLIDFNAKKPDGSEVNAANLPVDPEEMGTEVLAKVRTWIAAGHVMGVKRYELKATENNSVQLFLGEDKPIASAYTTNASTGDVNPIFTVRSFGTLIEASPRITESEVINLTFNYQRSQIAPDDEGVVLAKGPNQTLVSPATTTNRVNTTVAIKDAHSTIVSGFQSVTEAGRVFRCVVLSASIVDPNKPVISAAVDPAKSAAVAKDEQPPVPNQANPPENRPGTVVTPGFRRSRQLRIELRRNPDLAKRMMLSEEQTAKLAEISKEVSDMLRTMTPPNAESLQGLAPKIREIEQRTLDILTEEQKKIWSEYQSEVNSSGQEAPRPLPRVPPPTNESGTSVLPMRSRTRRTPEGRLIALNAQLETDASNDGLLTRRADIYFELGKPELAVADLRTAIASAEDPFSAYYNLALLLAHQQDNPGFQECLRELQKRINSSTSPYSKRQLADLMLLMPDPNNAAMKAFALLEESLTETSAIGPSRSFNFSLQESEKLLKYRMDLIRGQNLLAIHGLKELLDCTSDSHWPSKDLKTETELRLALALKSIGDHTGATVMLQTAENDLRDPPKSVSHIPIYLLLRQVQTSLREPD
jgi:tetratricopeptide (TPR) repeat protein